MHLQKAQYIQIHGARRYKKSYLYCIYFDYLKHFSSRSFHKLYFGPPCRIEFIIEKKSTLQVSNYWLYVHPPHNDWLNCYKRFYNRDTNSAAILCNTANVYQILLPFYATQMINSFYNSIISANHEKGEKFKPFIISLVRIFVKGG